MRLEINPFLADTWWYGLTRRLAPSQFDSLAVLRAQQGFTAIQIVVGIPPEVGPENPNASSQVGFPWTIDGEINHAYLEYAKNRIKFLNQLGLTGIIYGAWGHQIDWIGPRKMGEWWKSIVEYLDELNVIYCLAGEINLWIGQSSMLLPSKSTDELVIPTISRLPVSASWKNIIKKVGRRIWRILFRPANQKIVRRSRDWDYVLGVVSKITTRPILVHPTVTVTGFESVLRPQLLAANTAQTGHDESSRPRLWQLPLSLTAENPDIKYINLEPWYEGITGKFMAEDQLFSYWASMLGGAMSYCYGAHGIWNVGDGNFLSHWGKQTFSDAIALETPRLIGLSHKEFMHKTESNAEAEKFYTAEGNELISIGQKSHGRTIQYFPEISKAKDVPNGAIWVPLQGVFVDSLPKRGQVVIFSN